VPAPDFDEAAGYLADFGVDCQAGTTTFQALFDAPDALRQLADVSGTSRDYLITYATADVTLKRTDAVLVEGVEYKVREVPRQIGDGTFAEATLTKV
jgi:hypothetical protein